MFVAVCGDPVVGRALVLLLQDPRYDVRFVPTSSLSALGSLKGAQLVLVTPTWELNGESRDAFLATLRRALGAAEPPILELTSSAGAQNGEAREGSTRCPGPAALRSWSGGSKPPCSPTPADPTTW